VNVVLYTACVIKMKKSFMATTPEAKKIIYKLFAYPFILIFAWSFATVDRFYTIYNGFSFPLLMLHVCMCHTQGLWNSLYYGLNRMDELKTCWERIARKKVDEGSEYDRDPSTTVDRTLRGSFDMSFAQSEGFNEDILKN